MIKRLDGEWSESKKWNEVRSTALQDRLSKVHHTQVAMPLWNPKVSAICWLEPPSAAKNADDAASNRRK
jgi:hypothetical protein